MTLPSTNNTYVASTFETFCGGPGFAQDSFWLAIRNSRDKADTNYPVFVSDDSPDVHWTDDDQLEVEIRGFGRIGRSYHEAHGVYIKYVVDLEKIQSSLEQENHRIVAAYPSDAPRINAATQNQFDTFLAWAKANATLLN